MRVRTRWGLLGILILILGVSVWATLRIDNPLSWAQQWALIWHPQAAARYDDFYYLYGTLPRLAVAVLGGATLGLVGSLIQQLTLNRMASPLTLGTSSGAWCAIVVASAWLPNLTANGINGVAFVGALAAFLLIVAITGWQRMNSLSIVMSGMVVNLLLGALATAVVVMQSQFATNIFLWGAGDLAQNGWQNFEWLVIRIVPVLLLLIVFAPKILTLLGLGHESAKARGLNVVPTFMLLMGLGIWSVSALITVTGILNFTGLIAPNIARALGARSSRAQLVVSAGLGALLLVATDALSVYASVLANAVVPTGVLAAAVGTPLFLFFLLRRENRPSAQLWDRPTERTQPRSKVFWGVAALLSFAVLMIHLTITHVGTDVAWRIPDAIAWSQRWPRTVVAIFAGAGFAMAGVILQRQIHNPLASPDLLGVSSGATFAVVLAMLLGLTPYGLSAFGYAILGSILILVGLLWVTRRLQYDPTLLILVGIATSAFLDAFTTLTLSKGTLDTYSILEWLSGSTYRASADVAILLALSVTLLGVLCWVCHRALTLLGIGRDFAAARGAAVQIQTVAMMVASASLCALSTAAMGPVAFLGLACPHMAYYLGAKRVRTQLVVSAWLGATLLLVADTIGQNIVFPQEVPAGMLAAMVGATYFLVLMIQKRR